MYVRETFARADLRVDEHPQPMVELRRLLKIYVPKIPFFDLRAVNPEAMQLD